MLKRIEEVEIHIDRLLSQHMEHQDELILLHRRHQDQLQRLYDENAVASRKHTQQLSEIDKKLTTHKRASYSLAAMLRNIYNAVLELKDMVGQCSQLVVHLQVFASDHMYLRSLDPTRNKPVWLEDALGILRVIPTEWNLDWKASVQLHDQLV